MNWKLPSNWWVEKDLRHKDRIISCPKAIRYRKERMKFGVQILGTVKDSLCLDEEADNNL